MAVIEGHEPITSFEQWYQGYNPVGGRGGLLTWHGMAPCATRATAEYTRFKNEMDQRVANYEVLEKLADGEVISPKPDLPNISSGETSGIIRRIARNVVQNCPNVEVVSTFDDDDVRGNFATFILKSKIIGSDLYSNDMQQNLFASCKTSLTLGFACVIPVLLRNAAGEWFIKYDSIHYRDVFAEPGAKDVREATTVYVRRYLTRGEAVQLVLGQAPGWDPNALRLMLENKPPVRATESNPHQNKKHRGSIPEGYEVITRYTSGGEHFLTFLGFGQHQGMLLRIEKNKHPLGEHPVHFLVLEKDEQQPLGKSQVEQLIGRQDFQDLMLNGAMKQYYRNINPAILGFGTDNALPNLSPGKYTRISNPNARIEPFEVNTQTLMQMGQISQQNLSAMITMVGSADQQMAAQSGGGAPGMSQTPQGVEAQQAMVDITTNNYQKAVESFFSHYCSYALTLFFHELAATKSVKLTADARIKLVEAGFPTEKINDDGTVDMDFTELAQEYWVRCVPGSLTEMEDEKQLRILNQLFVPLSQAMPALAATQDQEALKNASKAMQYIIAKQIELSGSKSAKDIGMIWSDGDLESVNARDAKIAELEQRIEGSSADVEIYTEVQTQTIAQLQEQVSMLTENMGILLNKLGAMEQGSTDSSGAPAESVPAGV